MGIVFVLLFTTLELDTVLVKSGPCLLSLVAKDEFPWRLFGTEGKELLVVELVVGIEKESLEVVVGILEMLVTPFW